ncbi:CAP domain-containing protein [Streptomyces sp. NPDC058001]|uniref:CAP domain-containing protein n=1 Tax=Streptomyces sp. NPDC058001 TaxID=3346300 RepID=UPI0036EAABC0
MRHIERKDEEGQDMGRHRRSDAGRAAGTNPSTDHAPGSISGDATGEIPTAAYLRADAAAQAAARADYGDAPYEDTAYIELSRYSDDPYGYGQPPAAPYGGHAYGYGYGEQAAYRESSAAAQAMAASAFPETGPRDAYAWDVPVSEAETATMRAFFGDDDVDAGPVTAVSRDSGHRRRPRKRISTPVRTGLLGVSAAVAMGAVAMATGVLPGSGSLPVVGGGSSDKVQAGNSPSDLQTQGGTSGTPESESASPDRSSDSPTSPAPSATEAGAKPSAKPSEKPSPSKTSGSGAAAGTGSSAGGSQKTATKPPKPATTPPKKAPSSSAKAPAGSNSAEAQVLSLVNQERAKVGCSPVTADARLGALAEDFSKDMAARGFFDHTDPDGATPWDRAEKAGITGLGGENIARGQADAAAVMDAWMNSPGHRANILNCDFKTLGVGAHFASGGPWWTQDFGF